MHRTCAAPPVLQTFRVPKQLDLPAHFGPLDRDYAAYLLDLLHRFVVTRRKEGEGFRRLQRKLLKEYVPDRRLTGIIRTLESLGVIEVDHSYSTGVRSKGYRLTPLYVASQAHVCTNRRLAKKIRDYQEEREAGLMGEHKWLTGKLQHVEWDRERAMEIILTQHPDADSRYTDEEYQQLIREAWGRAERAVGGHLVVDQYGRTHTVMTSLPKALRKCVTIGGQNLVGIDIVNSQPLMAGVVATRYSESKHAKHRMATRDFSTRGTPYVTRELAAMRVRRQEMRQVTEELSSNMCCGAASGPINYSQPLRRPAVPVGALGADLGRYQLGERASRYQSSKNSPS